MDKCLLCILEFFKFLELANRCGPSGLSKSSEAICGKNADALQYFSVLKTHHVT